LVGKRIKGETSGVLLKLKDILLVKSLKW
jgi:hypothetical protein